MLKNEMLKKVVEATNGNYTQKEVDEVLAAFASVVTDTLKMDSKEKVSMPELGTFSVKHVKEREGTMKFGENKGSKWVKPAHNEITFKISSLLKDI